MRKKLLKIQDIKNKLEILQKKLKILNGLQKEAHFCQMEKRGQN